MKAGEAFRDTFGSDVKELTEGCISSALRQECARHEDEVTEALTRLTTNRLPVTAVLEAAHGQLKVIVRGSDRETRRRSEPLLGSAAFDRLAHDAYQSLITGESYRTRATRKRVAERKAADQAA